MVVEYFLQRSGEGKMVGKVDFQGAFCSSDLSVELCRREGTRRVEEFLSDFRHPSRHCQEGVRTGRGDRSRTGREDCIPRSKRLVK